MTVWLQSEYALLEAIQQTAESCSNTMSVAEVYDKIRALSQAKITARLMQEAREAMQGHEEFFYEPLQDHLLENLRNVRHVQIDPNLSSVEVFDEVLGGTYADLEAGRYFGRSIDEHKRYRIWKYGIYLPYFGRSPGYQATPESEGRVIADYATVIEDRLAKWGEKAPYWYFLEHGNIDIGGGEYSAEPFPTFGPSNFIAKTKLAAINIIQEVAEAIEREVIDQSEFVLEEAELYGRATTLSTEDVTLGPGWKRYTFVSSRGKVYYQYRSPMHRWATYEEMIAEFGE